MRIAVSGSIATDHLMTFAGRFSSQLLPDQLEHVSLSFLVEDLEVRRGGIGANICFGLGLLGLRPLLVGGVGADFGDYRDWLEKHGVDTGGVLVSQTRHTGRFTCVTDADQNQIASFYPGAMSESRDIDLGTLGQIDLVVISPSDPVAMVEHSAWCRANGVRFAADPSQQLAILADDAVPELIEGADLLFSNTYEAAMIEAKTGWSAAEVLGKVGTRITTHSADGAVIERTGEAAITVAAVLARQIVDPTGVGDAFRCGFLAAQSWSMSLERAAQMGAMMATWCIESIGPQEYTVSADDARARLEAAYGPDAATELVAHL